MALGDNTSNDIPLGVGYDANGNAKSFVELSAISVTNVSATQYWGLPAGSDGTLSGLSDTRVSSTGDRKPLHGESLVYSAGYWTPCAVIAGGGGGVSFPNGNTGDILYYQSDGTSVTSLSPTATPLNLATTDNLNTKQAETIQYVIDTYLPEVGGVDKNSLVITTGASAVSSLSGASGTIPYFEGTTPAPGLKTFAQILTNENYNIAAGTTYATTTSLATTTAYAEGVSAAVAASATEVALAYQPLHVNLTELAAISLSRGDILYVNSAGELVALGATTSNGAVLKYNTGTHAPYWDGP